jgi:hypothetical protein
MPHHGTPIIKEIRHGSFTYETLLDTLIGDALGCTDMINKLLKYLWILLGSVSKAFFIYSI